MLGKEWGAIDCISFMIMRERNILKHSPAIATFSKPALSLCFSRNCRLIEETGQPAPSPMFKMFNVRRAAEPGQQAHATCLLHHRHDAKWGNRETW